MLVIVLQKDLDNTEPRAAAPVGLYELHSPLAAAAR